MELLVKDLSFKYGKKMVLNSVSFKLSPGKVTAIMGPNATGKTTLIKCIAGILKASGEILYNGVTINNFNNNLISYLPQDGYTGAALRVIEVVLLGRVSNLLWKINNTDIEAAYSALRELDIENLAFSYINELSGGQQQLVYLAQSIVRNSKIMLFDEPINNLDIRHQIMVLEKIRELTTKRNIITVVVLHDINLAARYSDYVIVLKNGYVYEKGKPVEVFKNSTIENIWGVRVKLYSDTDVNVQIIPLGTC